MFRRAHFSLALCLAILPSSPLSLPLSQATAQTAEPPQLAAVRAADDARIAAMTHPSQEKLDTILSTQLHYTHSNGVVDTKASLSSALLEGSLRYLSMQYLERAFTFPSPDISLMTGRIRVQVKASTATLDAALSFLGVWKLEDGQWKFLAWQSCRLPTPSPTPQ